jgi:hypothetical protein
MPDNAAHGTLTPNVPVTVELRLDHPDGFRVVHHSTNVNAEPIWWSWAFDDANEATTPTIAGDDAYRLPVARGSDEMSLVGYTAGVTHALYVKLLSAGAVGYSVEAW